MIHQVPVLSTDRLVLKAVTIQDAPSYKKHFVDYEVIRFLSSAVPWPYPEDGVEYFLNNLVLPRQGKDRWCFGIFLKSNPEELIGCVDLWREPVPENRGFWLGKKYWGQGIMTEAVKPVMDYAFDRLGFEKLYFTNAVGNTASRRVKEKSGATYIEARAAKFVSPEFTQTELWELTKENWKRFSRPSFIGNYKDFIEEDNACYPNSTELLSIGSPIGRKLGLKMIGIHIETLPPGRRTSWPHAEKEEEEFAYVIHGKPQAWINGYIYDLKEGDFVAFPSGTGIAHTFINNTEENVLMLVGGEARKESNKIIYPLHPQRNEDMKKTGAFWEDSPVQVMGPHDGLPECKS